MNTDELVMDSNLKLSQTINYPELFNDKLDLSNYVA